MNNQSYSDREMRKPQTSVRVDPNPMSGYAREECQSRARDSVS
jgi:hypothetical protein